MAFHVQREVVASGEGALAARALEWPVPGVFPVVTRQLVGAGELPRAAGPRTLVRLFAGVGPQVRLQVRALVVRLAAAVERALVDRQPDAAHQSRPPTSPSPGGRRRADAPLRLEDVLPAEDSAERRPGRGDDGPVPDALSRVGRHRQRAAEALRTNVHEGRGVRG